MRPLFHKVANIIISQNVTYLKSTLFIYVTFWLICLQLYKKGAFIFIKKALWGVVFFWDTLYQIPSLFLALHYRGLKLKLIRLFFKWSQNVPLVNKAPKVKSYWAVYEKINLWPVTRKQDIADNILANYSLL